MAKNMTVNIVGTECAPEYEDKFNKWYNEVHIPLVLKAKELKKVTRYRLMGDNKEHAKYLAVYEYESQDTHCGAEQ